MNEGCLASAGFVIVMAGLFLWSITGVGAYAVVGAVGLLGCFLISERR